MRPLALVWAAFVDGFRRGELRAAERAIYEGMPLVGLSLSVTCRCAKCHVDRDIALSREVNGGRVLPIANKTDSGATYAAETKEACECGERRIVIRLRAK